VFDRISLEPSRFCSKGCAFCYNGSSPRGRDGFTASEVLALARDCAAHGVRFLSLGGGEPLEWDGLFEVLDGLRGVLGRSFTTNGLELTRRPALFDEIQRVKPDKVHVSIHAVENAKEVTRVLEQVLALDERGVPAGVNLLVKQSHLAEARDVVRQLEHAGLGRERIVFLPSRGIPGQTPSAQDVAWVATGVRESSQRFMSMSCLRGCAKSLRFVSIAADRTVAWCSYTIARQKLESLTHAAVISALTPLGLTPCDVALVRTLEPTA
jgi:MoaA/NifB/PqqE/SkfB family radical SAM enzyme